MRGPVVATATVVSIINLKGGVGRSTLTMMLGEFLSFRYGLNVLLIDMDAQANLSYCMVPDENIRIQEDQGRTAYHLLRNALNGRTRSVDEFITQPPLVVSNISRNGMPRQDTKIHMVVSTPSVAQLDEDLLQLWEQHEPMPTEIRSALKNAIDPVRDAYDYVLIDCPPGLSVFSSTPS
jgi:chromosome partitioning protein